MFRSNPPGFHTTLTPELHEKIISLVPTCLTPYIVAKCARLRYPTLLNWLKRGREDADKEQCTIFSQLAYDFEEKLGESLSRCVQNVLDCGKNWPAAWELLSSLDRENFGKESILYKDLLDSYKKLFESYKQLLESKTSQRIVEDAKEMDSKGD